MSAIEVVEMTVLDTTTAAAAILDPDYLSNLHRREKQYRQEDTMASLLSCPKSFFFHESSDVNGQVLIAIPARNVLADHAVHTGCGILTAAHRNEVTDTTRCARRLRRQEQ